MQGLNNSSLVARCINRDHLAWNKFVERFSPLIFWAIKAGLARFGFSYTRQDTEDIFQNVFVLLWEKEKLQQIRSRESITSWLAIVAANCACNFFRKKGERPLKDELLPERLASPDGGQTTGIAQVNPGNIDAILKHAFNYLSSREVIILKLNYLHNKTHQEIASLLNMPVNSVSSIIKRTREKLKEKLKEQEWENL
jgi:RNA polymerase sigma-70 factor (ECF subfamily)